MLQISYTNRGRCEDGRLGSAKKLKMPFLRDISKSFQEVTPMGPEPHHFFLFEISQQIWLISIQSLGQNRPWLAG